MALMVLHRSGVPHLHVLFGAFLPQDWLSKAWQAVGGGKIVHIKFADVHRVTAYFSKYLTKDSLAEIPSGVRRYSCSKGIALWERKAKNPCWWREGGISRRKLCPRFKDFAKDDYFRWFEKQHEVHPRTHMRYKTSFRPLNRFFCKLPLDAISTAHVKRFKQVRSEYVSSAAKHEGSPRWRIIGKIGSAKLLKAW
jgi:hypothetical protein